ncbi:MAG: glycosyltransferase family 2 protein [Planctomycetota bacterium]
MNDELGSASENLELSILMPCLDEAATLAPCIKEALLFLERHSVRGEVVVADNGSADQSLEIAAQESARVVQVEASGYGATVAAGVVACRGKFVLVGDSDGSYDFSEAGRFLDKLRVGNDLVIGNRFKGGIEVGAMPFLQREIAQPFISWIARRFFNSGIGDCYCGLRGFRRDAIQKLQLRTREMEYPLEMIVKAVMFGLKICEVPATYSIDGREDAPRLKSFSDYWRSLRFFLLFSPRWLFWYPSLALTLLGLVGGLVHALPVYFGSEGAVLSPNKVIYAITALTIGLQGVAFSVFSKILAIRSGLHPRRKRVEEKFSRFRLEVGLVWGLALIAIAVETFFVGGKVAPNEVVEVGVGLGAAAISSLLLAVGAQLVFTSFFVGLLQIEFTDTAAVGDAARELTEQSASEICLT